MDVEVRRHGDQLLVELTQALGGHVRLDLVLVERWDDLVARLRRDVLPERLLQVIVGGAEALLHLLGKPLHLLARDDALCDESLGELREDGRVAGDRRSHQRLRVGGLVLLVVAEAAVADEVDDHVAAEPLAVGQREPDRRERRRGVVGVDVDDRHVVALGDVARVEGRAPLGRVGREADLVVGDQVQRAARRVPGQVGEVQRLGDDALARERRVAVDEDAERAARVVARDRLAAVGLLGARAALGDRVDELEVARVRHQRDADLAARRLPRRAHAEVVLHVAGAALVAERDGLDRPLALELAQDRVVRAADDVREHVEPAAVRHAEHDVLGAVHRGELDRLVEHRHEQVEPLDRELLLAEEAPAQVRLEALDLAEAAEQPPLLVLR